MSIQKKKSTIHLMKHIYYMYLILITFSIISVTTYQQLDFRKHELADKQKELFNVTKLLDHELAGSYEDILIRNKALGLSRQGKIEVINKNLQPRINELTRIFPGIGMGYYDNALQARVALGPEFNMVKAISPLSKQLQVAYKSRKPQFIEIKNSTMWNRQPVITLSYPIFHNGEMIGRVFANIRTTDTYTQILKNTIYVTIFCLLIIIIFNYFSWFYTKKVQKELTRFTDSIIGNESSSNENLLPELKPIAQQIRYYQDEVITNALEKERLITITQLSAGLANDIRNPLTAVKGFLQLLQETINNKEIINNKENEYIKITLSEVENINDLITRMLYLAQPPECNYSSTDVKLTINSIIASLTPIADLKGVVIKSDIQEDLPAIVADKEQLKKIFINIFYNALEAINENLGEINIKVFEQDNNVCIYITDNGVGIMQENIKKVFDPLYTTKNNGCGLGLAICKDIITRHKGEIDINSNDGKGTTVKLMLPGAYTL